MGDDCNDAVPRCSTLALDLKMRASALAMRLIAGIALLACIYGASGLLGPPYTDQQIRASIVDTWAVEAIATLVVLVLLLACFVIAVCLVLKSPHLRRSTISLAAVGLSAVALGLVFASHVALTVRTTRITHKEFGPVYGLPWAYGHGARSDMRWSGRALNKCLSHCCGALLNLGVRL